MKKKKIMITAIIIVVFVICITFAIAYLNSHKLQVIDKTDLNLDEETCYSICESLLDTRKYTKIIKYYPQLFECDIYRLVKNDDSLNSADSSYGRNVDMFIYTYLNAVYEKYGKNKLYEEFITYADLLSFNNECGTFEESIPALQIYFLKNYNNPFSTPDKKEIRAFLAVLDTYFVLNEHDAETINSWYDFASDWYGEIGDIVECVKFHKYIEES